ncbi:hypothetical protein ASPWEDRAFT_739639 [Aspergillus wentii DTO 134E9]|uniref:Major facilitator superfamily (MFS) profile domain-containing protein n=1 Tax=Aspergillus wentii DTO 134E9 TaxID=1073089 RepID=A0A1L9RIW1_ASPWE|nr:uncharacterized protein ASPWEDRAFT_739639 [Aspergillus wentii DTO 134E9]OJJ34880.1 hypothetical protein ASPWEDRAFT_739639 [Aspergillus wentii DTO 134E9]
MFLSRFKRLKSGDSSKEPVFLRFRSSKRFIIGVVVNSIFVDIVLYGVIVPVVPAALHTKIHPTVHQVQQWTSILLALYGVALLFLAPVAGFIADRTKSRKKPFLVGLLNLAGATSFLFFGSRLPFWIIGRLLQGASAAVVWTVGLAIIVDTAGKKHLGESLGFASMAATLGVMCGPAVYEHGGYHAVFGMSYGLVAVDIALKLSIIERKQAAKWLDIEIHETAESPVDSDPKIHFRSIRILLSSRRIIPITWSYFVSALVLSAFDSILPLYIENLFHWKQTAQGLIFIPLSVPNVLGPVVGIIIDKYDKSRRFLCSGAFLACTPNLVLLRLITKDTFGHKVLLCALLGLIGLCVTIVLPSMTVEVSLTVKEKEEESPDIFGKGGAMALAHGIVNASFATGLIAGPFFAGFIRQAAGWGAATWAVSIVTGVTAIPMVLLLGGPIWERRDEKVEEHPSA